MDWCTLLLSWRLYHYSKNGISVRNAWTRSSSLGFARGGGGGVIRVRDCGFGLGSFFGDFLETESFCRCAKGLLTDLLFLESVFFLLSEHFWLWRINNDSMVKWVAQLLRRSDCCLPFTLQTSSWWHIIREIIVLGSLDSMSIIFSCLGLYIKQNNEYNSNSNYLELTFTYPGLDPNIQIKIFAVVVLIVITFSLLRIDILNTTNINQYPAQDLFCKVDHF